MTPESIDNRELIKNAIVAEIDGQKFYKFLADKATNVDARRKLTNLAKDEIRHETILIKIYKDLFDEEVENLPNQGVSVLSRFFSDRRETEPINEIQCIDMAIEAELAATEFYKSSAESADNDEIKDIYAQMANEEFRHYELLKAEREAVTGNYSWFEFDETSPMEL
ncbi:MAG: ferritin family protein [FCB group bacterium]|nr:ferritin family protein [FCB group bacterium]